MKTYFKRDPQARLICSLCRTEQPEEEFAFQGPIRKRTGVRHRGSRCRSCEVKRVGIWQQKSPQIRKAQGQRYRLRNPEKRSAGQRARQLMKRQQRCVCCTQNDLNDFYRNRPDGFHVDHRIALARGGLHCVKNFQYLDAHQNQVKGVRLV